MIFWKLRSRPFKWYHQCLYLRDDRIFPNASLRPKNDTVDDTTHWFAVFAPPPYACRLGSCLQCIEPLHFLTLPSSLSHFCQSLGQQKVDNTLILSVNCDGYSAVFSLSVGGVLDNKGHFLPNQEIAKILSCLPRKRLCVCVWGGGGGEVDDH